MRHGLSRSVQSSALGAALLLAALGGLQAGPAADLNIPTLSAKQRLETVLTRFDEAQQAITTLQADFIENKDIALLSEPTVSEGRFYFARPLQAKWEYTRPERKIFLIQEGMLQQYFPAEKLLEKKDLSSGNTNRLFKLLGFGQTSKQLQDFYDIKLETENTEPGTYLLTLTPRMRAIGKRVSRVQMWVGDNDFLPRAMRQETPSGDVTRLTFKNMRLNQTVAASVFRLDVPGDVRVKDQISLFTGAAQKKSSP
jgi:outer membrane lipoprotein-sorting protein